MTLSHEGPQVEGNTSFHPMHFTLRRGVLQRQYIVCKECFAFGEVFRVFRESRLKPLRVERGEGSTDVYAFIVNIEDYVHPAKATYGWRLSDRKRAHHRARRPLSPMIRECAASMRVHPASMSEVRCQVSPR